MASSLESLGAYWNAIDSLDADRVALQFAAQGCLHYRDNPPLRGRPAIRRAFVHLFAEIEAICHDPVALWCGGALVTADADVSLVVEHGASLTLPATTVLWTSSQGILACRLLLYPEPALARAFRGFESTGQPILAAAGFDSAQGPRDASWRPRRSRREPVLLPASPCRSACNSPARE